MGCSALEDDRNEREGESEIEIKTESEREGKKRASTMICRRGSLVLLSQRKKFKGRECV